MNRGIELWNIIRLNDAELTVNIRYIDFDKVKEIANITTKVYEHQEPTESR